LSQLQPVATGRVAISFCPLQRESGGRCEWTTELATKGCKARTFAYSLTRFSLPDTRRVAGQVMCQCVCVGVGAPVYVSVPRACARMLGIECTPDTAHRVHTW